MNYKFISLLLISFLFIQCEQKQNEEIEIGKITERSPEEVASIKEYAPQFAFESIEGNTVSLADLKGKYLYIDIWATWCRPCLQQLPAMKELEEKYRDKNIEFVSISVDKDADKPKWKNMVDSREMKGIQLFAGKRTSFHQDYGISTIPKFLIIGKEGEIINENPPRPMDYRNGEISQELVSILDKLVEEDTYEQGE